MGNEKKLDIITVDGPAGAGKSTICKNVAEKLGINYFSSGMIFRTVGYKLLEENIKLEEEERVLVVLNNIDIEIKNEQMYLEGKHLEKELREDMVTKMAVDMSVINKYHKRLIELQRKIFLGNLFIIEGRETSTVLFPDSKLKIFLDADVEIRAERMHKDKIKKNEICEYEEVLEKLKARDYKDYNEKGEACLKVLDESVYINSTNMTQEEVVHKIVEVAKKVLKI